MPVAVPSTDGHPGGEATTGVAATAAGLAWRPGAITIGLLTVATLVGAWMLLPPGPGLGGGGQALYAAASVSDAGGNPYDFELLHAEQKRLGLAPAAAPYAYPPVLTAAAQALLPLGPLGFRLVGAAVTLAAGLAAYRLCTITTGWRDSRLGGWALLVSAPFVLGELLGDASNLVFLAWALGFYALARGRPVAAGAVLALTLVSPGAGVAAVLALALAAPATAGLLLMGFAAGGALYLAVNVLVLGPGAFASWLETLVPALEGNTSAPGTWSGGVAALLTGHVPTFLGVVVGLGLALAIVAVALRDGRSRVALASDPLLRVALCTAALLPASPYLRASDLVLETVPLMVLASRRLSPPVQAALVAWGVGMVMPLTVAVALDLSVHRPGAAAPALGATLAVLILLGLSSSLRPPRVHGPQRPPRPWGPVPVA